MPSKAYWINRANQRMDDYILQAEKTADEIAKAYYKASRMIEKDMVKVIQGLSAISDTRTAVQALINNPSKKILSQLRSAVLLMPEGKERQEALTLISSPAYQFRLRRLQSTIDNARRRCDELYKVELTDVTQHLRNVYGSAFSHTMYDIDKGYNTLHTFSQFPASRVNYLLKSKWSGMNYSDRIWNSTQGLADVLKEQLLISFMTGASVSETSRVIRDQFQSSAYAARRLVRTETNFVANQAELDSYKRLGIEEYQYIATLDTRTSKLCQRLDGQIFNIDDAKPGVNYPPMHPNCRSTTIAYDAEDQIQRRAARDEKGNLIEVPGNMKYDDWLKKYHPELIPVEFIQHRSAARGDESFVITRDSVEISYKSLPDSKHGLFISDKANIKPKSLNRIESRITEAYKVLGITDAPNKPKIIIVNLSETNGGAIGSYNAGKNVLYIVDKYGDKDISELQKDGAAPDNPLSTIVHELIHWQDAQKYRDVHGRLDTNEALDRYYNELISKCKEKLDSKVERDYNYIEISPYADKMAMFERYDEVYTEYRVLKLLKG